MTARLTRLAETHRQIDRALVAEQKRRRPDPDRTRQLKKLKLRIKDLMARLNPRSATA